MSDAYTIPSFFSDDPRGGALSYDQLQARRKIAAALATRQRGFPKNIGEGLTYLGESLGEMMGDRRLAGYEAQQAARDNAARQALTGDGTVTPAPAAPPAPAAVPGPVSAAPATDPEAAVMALAQPEKGPVAEATATRQPLTPDEAAQQPQMSIEEWKSRIARNESGGQRDPYSTVGERSRKGDYPYGKYQVMGANVPKWTAAYLGKEMTPKEFLADPDAQEKVATARGNEYITKYGSVGAAQAWFGGENWRKDPRATDTLGTHVAEYTRRFNIPLVSREQVVASAARAPASASAPAFAPEEGGGAPPVQLASLGGGAPAREAITNALAGPRPVPAPTAQPVPAPPQQVAQLGPPTVRAPTAEARPTPAGPEPTLRAIIGGNPQLQQQMENARRIALDPSLSPAMQASAQARYQELEKRANDEFTKRWTVWHERTKGEEAFRLGAKERQRAEQKDIVPVPPASQQAGPDPRLGTPASPQRTRIPVPPAPPPGTTPEAWSKEQTPQLAKAIEAVDKATPAFDDAVKALQLARQHPGREWGVGATSKIATSIPGTDAYGFGKIMEQIQGKNFLTAYQQLKGGGAITEIEGTKAEAAQARLATAQNKKDWDAAMNDLETALRRDMELAQRKVNAPVTAWRAPGDNASFAPDIGERRGDKEYIGGNPADPMSWKRAP